MLLGSHVYARDFQAGLLLDETLRTNDRFLLQCTEFKFSLFFLRTFPFSYINFHQDVYITNNSHIIHNVNILIEGDIESF